MSTFARINGDSSTWGWHNNSVDTAEADFTITLSTLHLAGSKIISCLEPRQSMFKALAAHSSRLVTAFIDNSVDGFHQGQDEDHVVGWQRRPKR